MTCAALPALPYGRRSAAWFHRRTVQLVGSRAAGIHVPEDMTVDAALNVNNFPARVGVAMAPTLAGRCTIGRLNSRTAIVGRPAQTAPLGCNLATTVQGICAIFTPPARGGSFAVYADSPQNDGSIQEGTNALFPSALYVSGGWTHIIDRVAYEFVTAGIHVYFANCTTTTSPQIRLGTNAGPYNPQCPQGAFVWLNGQLVGGEVTAMDSIYREYYGIRG